MKENTEQLSSEEKQYRKMTEEPVCRLIMKLGLPTTISMLITNVYNMVDTWFVSPAWNKCDRSSWYCVCLMAIIQAFGFMFGRAAEQISAGLWGHIKRSGHVHFRQQDFTWLLLPGQPLVCLVFSFRWFVPVTGKYRDNFTICKNICILCFAFCTGNGDRLCNEQYFAL